MIGGMTSSGLTGWRERTGAPFETVRREVVGSQPVVAANHPLAPTARTHDCTSFVTFTS